MLNQAIYFPVVHLFPFLEGGRNLIIILLIFPGDQDSSQRD